MLPISEDSVSEPRSSHTDMNVYTGEDDQAEYEELTSDCCVGPTATVLRHAESPIDIFWVFIPKRLM
ncbi:unnamed protein product [Phytophthora fragariaefolia]|uniref:Unnamed protein product n=1 Tax=Phytophthora fragariaefolia TaxID=1490495 RepID=A0A9W6TMB4_9STRA|nr:unnamed protein product [Phytophthora fragariaefolia]